MACGGAGVSARYHRLRVEGLEHVPVKPPFVMIANHSSHLDVLTLGAELPWRLRRSAFPIAAGDVFFETPAVSTFSAMMLNALPMWRKRCGSHAMQELRDRLIGDPAIYLLFPEGKRSRDGTMSPYKPGLGMMIAGAPVPVVPCWIEGAFHAFRPETKFPQPKPISLRIGPPLLFDDVKNERAGWQDIAAPPRSRRHRAARCEGLSQMCSTGFEPVEPAAILAAVPSGSSFQQAGCPLAPQPGWLCYVTAGARAFPRR